MCLGRITFFFERFRDCCALERNYLFYCWFLAYSVTLRLLFDNSENCRWNLKRINCTNEFTSFTDKVKGKLYLRPTTINTKIKRRLSDSVMITATSIYSFCNLKRTDPSEPSNGSRSWPIYRKKTRPISVTSTEFRPVTVW